MKTRKEVTPENSIGNETVAASVAKIIARTVCDHRGHGAPSEAFVYNPATRLLSCCLDVGRDSTYNLIRNCARASYVNLIVRGLRTSFVVPPWINDDGENVADWIGSLASLSECVARAGVRLPFDVLDPKSGAAFVDGDYATLYASDSLARFSDPSRVIPALNAWLKRMRFDPLDQIATNPLLAEIEAAHVAAVFSCQWASDDISDIYSSEDRDGRGWSSCMAGKPSGWFEVYDDLQARESLRLIHLLNGLGERIGRALCWQGSNPDDLYLDRMYLPESNGVQVPQAIEAFRSFCLANDIRKAVFGATATKLDLTLCNLSVLAGEDLAAYEAYPYADSMFRVCSDNRLRNHTNFPSGVSELGQMRCTDGSAESIGANNEDYVVLSSGERVHRDDATYVDSRDEWYDSEDCVYTRDDTTELLEDCEELSSDFYTRGSCWALREDCCTDYDGRWILDRDAYRMHDGEMCHTEDEAVVSTHDGELALYVDCVCIDADDNEHALRDECDELTAGGWCLSVLSLTLPNGDVIRACDEVQDEPVITAENEAAIFAARPDLEARALALLDATASI